MLVRYHLFYYAVGSILTILGRYFHPLFYLFLCLYLVWLYYRLTYKHLLIAIGCCLLMLIPQSHDEKLPTTLSGTVIKTGDKYCYLKSDIGTIKLYHEEEFHFNDNLTCEISPLEMNANTNDNAFNEQIYLYSQKIFYKAKLERIIDYQQDFQIYQWIENRFSSSLDIQNYQRLFLFGERTEDIEDEYLQLSELSLVHMFALSGMHVHLMFFMLKRGLGLFFQKRLSKIIAYLIIGIYVFSIPMQISLYRAFFVLILYELFKKWFHQLDVLSFLVMISFLYNPYIIFSVSFVFSYFIYFIVLITKNIKYSTVLIYLSSIPILLNLNYQIPIVSLIVGVIMTPFIELFYCLTVITIFIPYIQSILYICIYILQSILSFLDFCNTFFMFSKPNLIFVIMYYYLFFMIVYKMELRKSIQKYVSMMIALMLVFYGYSEYKIYGEITMIDVGQGDCTLIRLPMNQGNILIDTGGNKDFDLATKTIIPYLKSVGIHHLDYVYISHSDFDHNGALESLLNNFRVDHVIDEYEEYREIGIMKVKMLKTDTYYTDTNDQSLIMKIDIHDFSMLLTGDASVEVEKELFEKYGETKVDILKVGHHGSQTSTSVEILQMCKPRIAMIGVKKNNMYRHPSAIVIERLKRKNITILRTDNDGMFHLRFYLKSRYIFR
ncbi:MAG: DNA internalization-related competence protein ComEC/Rec2 [Coprobacillus sp.]